MSQLVYHGTPCFYPEVDGDRTITISGSTGAGSVTGLSLGVPLADDVPALITPADNVGIAAIRFPKPVRLAALRVIPGGVVCGAGVGETDLTSFTAEVFLNVAPSDPVNALFRTTVSVWPAEHALEFGIDMPPGTSTRLMVIRAPVKKVTMSLYAHGDDVTPTPTPKASAAPARSAPTTLPLPAAKDLIAAIPLLATETADTRARALATLAVLARSSFLLEAVLESGHVGALLSTEGSEAAIRSILCIDTGNTRGLEALTHLDAPSVARHPFPESQLELVLQLARVQQASTHPHAAAGLSATVKRLGALVNTADGLVGQLARVLPPLAVHATTRGVYTPIPVSTAHARVVATALLPVSAQVTATHLACAPAAVRLVQPFLAVLPDDGLRRAWERASPSASPLLLSPGTSGTPRTISPVVANLQRALASPSSSLALNPTPAEVLAVVAPNLLAALSTAPAPPLGIPPLLPRGTSGSASDYAGKVYSAHEFRRERDTVSGLGIGLVGVGRKASRHVDDFARKGGVW